MFNAIKDFFNLNGKYLVTTILLCIVFAIIFLKLLRIIARNIAIPSLKKEVEKEQKHISKYKTVKNGEIEVSTAALEKIEPLLINPVQKGTVYEIYNILEKEILITLNIMHENLQIEFPEDLYKRSQHEIYSYIINSLKEKTAEITNEIKSQDEKLYPYERKILMEGAHVSYLKTKSIFNDCMNFIDDLEKELNGFEDDFKKITKIIDKENSYNELAENNKARYKFISPIRFEAEDKIIESPIAILTETGIYLVWEVSFSSKYNNFTADKNGNWILSNEFKEEQAENICREKEKICEILKEKIENKLKQTKYILQSGFNCWPIICITNENMKIDNKSSDRIVNYNGIMLKIKLDFSNASLSRKDQNKIMEALNDIKLKPPVRKIESRIERVKNSAVNINSILTYADKLLSIYIFYMTHVRTKE